MRWYEWRRSILEGTAGDDLIGEWIDSVVTEVVESEVSSALPRSDWDWEAPNVSSTRSIRPPSMKSKVAGAADDVVEFAVEEALDAYANREEELGAELLRQVERSVMLSVIDKHGVSISPTWTICEPGSA